MEYNLTYDAIAAEVLLGLRTGGRFEAESGLVMEVELKVGALQRDTRIAVEGQDHRVLYSARHPKPHALMYREVTALTHVEAFMMELARRKEEIARLARGSDIDMFTRAAHTTHRHLFVDEDFNAERLLMGGAGKGDVEDARDLRTMAFAVHGMPLMTERFMKLLPLEEAVRRANAIETAVTRSTPPRKWLQEARRQTELQMLRLRSGEKG